MENKELQDLETTSNVSLSQDMENENVEITDNTINQSTTKDEIKEIPSDLASKKQKSKKNNSIESIPEANQATDDIEKLQDKKTELDYSLLSREELCEMLEEIVKVEDISAIKSEVALIKVTFHSKDKEIKEALLDKFIEEGGKKEDYIPVSDPVTERFDTAFSIYREKKVRFNEDFEKQKQENLASKIKILNDLKLLVESEEELKKTYDAFKNLQEQWKVIGLVPKTEINNLWQNYNFLVEKFFDKVKINKELKDLDLRKNFEAKMVLCEKAEELLLETSVIKSFTQLQKYHEMWREIGPVLQDKKDEIWERFRNVTDKINERRREYYDKLREEQEKNIETKTAICEKAEQIAELIISTAKEWQDQTAVIDEMLKAWKTIGPAPKKQNDELWIRFKTAVDNFFGNKKEFFSKLKDDQVNNYNQKLNLCLQAEAAKISQDWKNTTLEFIRLQKEWKNIGPVPKKYSDIIWKRFRSACDDFFNAKAAYFSNIDSKEEENLKLKKDLIQQVKDYQFGPDNNENLQIIKDFQRKWMEIGHVPLKYKNEVHLEFRDAINANLDKLQISAIEKNTIGFKSKFETIAHTPGAEQVIYKEKSAIIAKINAMKNDIKLWENNIGFFANSKKANVLKEEFLNKIEKAKQDILVMEEKIKFLREVK